jgi:hypothetical protein
MGIVPSWRSEARIRSVTGTPSVPNCEAIIGIRRVLHCALMLASCTAPSGCSSRGSRTEELVVLKHHRQRSSVPFQCTDVDGFTFGLPQIVCVQQVLDRRGIIAAAGQCRFDRLLQLLLSMLLRQFEQFNHLPRAILFSVTLHERFPDPVEARRPQTGLALLLLRLRSRERARLAIQDIQVMLLIDDLLLPPVTTLVPGHASARMTQLDGTLTCSRMTAQPPSVELSSTTKTWSLPTLRNRYFPLRKAARWH